MTGSVAVAGRPTGAFMSSGSGRRFVLHVPCNPDRSRDYVIFVAPFAEEMNKARRMWSLLSQRLARHGIGSVMIDFVGTGDSEGELDGVRIADWLEDLAHAELFARDSGARSISWCALRFGALLNAAYLAKHSHADVSSTQGAVVWWQPVLSGRVMLTQFLRLKLAASLHGEGKERETPNRLREQLQAGRMVEVAGYPLSKALVSDIDELELTSFVPSVARSVHWFEIVTGGGNEPLPALPAACANLRIVQRRGVTGEPFWLRPEITVVPALLDCTESVFAAQSHG
jgi:exosortase A-associated hydrolase 2